MTRTLLHGWGRTAPSAALVRSPRTAADVAAAATRLAPYVRRTPVLRAEVDGHPVLAREGRLLVAAFHPELTDDTRVHERFLNMVREWAAGRVRA